jgi:hypothetical protein
MGSMNLRSLRITTYLAPIAFMVACGSNASTETPLATGDDGQDASTSNSSGGNGSEGSSGNGSSGNGSSSGDDDSTPTPTPSSCAQDSDCAGECDGSVVCCCDLNSVTCYSPASGQCGGDDAGDDDAGNTGGGFPI